MFPAQKRNHHSKRNSRGRRDGRRRLRLENLESRRLLATITVNSLADNLTSGDALVTLREAIAAANNDSTTDLGQTGSGADTIQFSGAALAGTIPLTMGELAVSSALTIEGPGRDELTIDARGNSRIFNVTGIHSVTIEDLTLTGGQAPANQNGGAILSDTIGTFQTRSVNLINNQAMSGGAIYASAGSLVVNHGLLQDNFAQLHGGAVYSSAPVMTRIQSNAWLNANSTESGNGGAVYVSGSPFGFAGIRFVGNHAVGHGGAIYVTGADTTITGTTRMFGNSAGGNGGAIRVDNGDLDALVDLEARGNVASGAGGAIAVTNGDLEVVGSSITGNQSGDRGGGIFTNSSTFSLNRSEVSNNTAGTGAGGIYVRANAVTIERSTIAGNFADDNGGGMLALVGNTGNMTITTSTVSGNTATLGGGLYIAPTATTTNYLLDVVGSTITRNSAGTGGGLHLKTAANIKSTIIAENNAQSSAPDIINSQSFTLVDSLIGNNNGTSLTEDQPPIPDSNGNFIGSPANPVEPRLSALGQNGGATRTHALFPDSPAIDSGGLHGQTIDQRGYRREFPVGNPDMGAYELGQFVEVDHAGDLSDTNPGDGICRASNGRCTLRAAIEETNALPNLGIFEPDVIYFDISLSGVNAINPATILPTITDRVIIDATSESDYIDVPRVQIEGGGTITDGLVLDRFNSVVRGLSVTGFTDAGIELREDDAAIEASYLGLNPDGTANGNFHGIRVQGANNAIIDGNVISGNNRAGVFINGGNRNVVINNKIGTDPNGVFARPNATDGITNYATSSFIGLAGQGNLISGNARWGVFTRFDDRNFSEIVDNKIGTDFSGVNPLPNVIGVYMQNGPNRVGGGGAEGNVISGNSAYGVAVSFTTGVENEVYGNAIGVDETGTTAVPNTLFGVRITQGNENKIGRATEGLGNLISANGTGVLMVLPATTGNRVTGNRIGTNISGDSSLGNNLNGIRIAQDASDNIIEHNQIAGNVGRAVNTDGAATTGNDILFNLIGTDSTGASPLHNGTGGALRLRAPGSRVEGNKISSADDGIFAFGQASNLEIVDNQIGGPGLGMTNGIRILTGSDDNVIANNIISNNSKGVVVVGSTGNKITSNAIHDNAQIGIDLGDDGATVNDTGDGDSGANELQNSPKITQASLSPGKLTVGYVVDTHPGAAPYPLTIEFFLSDGNGQGKLLIGSDQYSTPLTPKTIVLIVAGLNIGDEIVGTVTDSEGNTSEFSMDVTVT